MSHNVFLGEKLMLARQRLPWIHEKLDRGLEAWRYRSPAEAAAGDTYHHIHRGVDGNNWLCAVVTTAEGLRVYTMMWWQLKGRVDALQVVPEGRAFHFYGHLFSQYRERLTKTRDVITNLHQFFRYNHQLKMMHLGYKHKGRWAVAGVVPQGLVLGAVNGPHLISCKTYIPRDQLNQRKAALHDMLLAHPGDKLPPSHSADMQGLHEE